MTHEGTPHQASEHITAHPEHHSHGTAAPYFPEAEWAEFRSEDVHAAKAIVTLMLGIFCLGLVGYLAVAWWVSQGA
jgi:hypothetical protein